MSKAPIPLGEREEKLWQPNEANKTKTGVKEIQKITGESLYTDTAHTSQSSTITMWPGKKGPIGFRDGEEGWGESQEITAARDVGGDRAELRAFSFFFSTVQAQKSMVVSFSGPICYI